MPNYLGMRGTGDWNDTEILDEEWRKLMFYLEPNGDMPITGITSMINSEVTPIKFVNWVTDYFSAAQGVIAGVFTDAALTTAYDTGTAAKGSTLYLQMAEALSEEFRAQTNASITDEDTYLVNRNVEVTATTQDGTDSYLTVKLLEADTYADANSIGKGDWIKTIGSIEEEGADYPEAISYSPTPFKNVTGIIRTPLEITRTQYYSKNLRVNPQAYEYMKGKVLIDHGRDIEYKLLWSKYDDTSMGPKGKPKYSPMGLNEFIDSNVSANVFNFRVDTDYTAKTWLESGDAFLKKALETIFMYGNDVKFAVCGPTVIRGITDLAEVNGQYVLDWRTEDYGLRIATFHSPYGSIDLKVHPLFRFNTADKSKIMVIEPSNITPRPFTASDVVFYEDDRKHDKFSNGVDAVQEEYLSEITWEYHNPETFGIINGVGMDNVLT